MVYADCSQFVILVSLIPMRRGHLVSLQVIGYVVNCIIVRLFATLFIQHTDPDEHQGTSWVPKFHVYSKRRCKEEDSDTESSDLEDADTKT